MNILFLESNYHYSRANIINVLEHFPDSNIKYNGAFYYKNGYTFFSNFDLVISTVFTSKTNDYIISKCKRWGVRTLLLSDGIIEWENMFINPYLRSKNIKLYHPIIHDYFAVSGCLEKKYFNISSGTKCINFVPERMKSKIVTDSTNSKERKFLITTANTPYFNDVEKVTLISALLDIQSELLRLGINYKVRLYDESLLKTLMDKDPNLFNDISNSFDECLKDVCAVFTSPSSICLTSMEKSLPVCQIVFRNSPIFVQTGWMLTSLCQVKATITQMIGLDKERMDFQSAVLQRYNISSSLTEQINIIDKDLQKVDEDFYASRFTILINLEPTLRFFDDLLKTFLPVNFKKRWRAFLKSVNK